MNEPGIQDGDIVSVETEGSKQIFVIYFEGDRDQNYC